MIMMIMMMMMMRRKRGLGRRREIKAVSVEVVNAQAAFYQHFKSSSPTHLESSRAPADPLPVQLNSVAPDSRPCKLVLRNAVGEETPGLAHCPVCYDVLVPETGNRQQQRHVTTVSDVTKHRSVMAVSSDTGQCLAANSRDHINRFNSMSSV